MPQTAAAWTNHDFYLTEGSTNKFSALLHECDSGGGGTKTEEIAAGGACQPWNPPLPPSTS